ncbi:MAG: S24 family peptidase [bacterium]|nr:S24 family peptidase [bacterium]
MDLLRVAQDKNLGAHTLREIGSFIGEKSPQKIKHHLGELEKKGLLKIDKQKGIINKVKQAWESSLSPHGKLLTIPILGSANAGPAQIFAETNIEGFLKISSTLLLPPTKKEHRFFALKVVGDSMNRAEIGKKRIENGDYVIVDADEKSVKNGDIVLSIIDGMANIKKFVVDPENEQIVLMPQSSKDYPPIYIHEDDDFMINGKVIQVIKKPRFIDK